MTATAEAAPAAAAPSVDSTLIELVKVLQRLGRADLADRATAAAARLKRPSTIVCVVGEFKQGKSSLINALLGQTVCPVDDDLATSAITLVRYGDQSGAVVRRREGNTTEALQIPVADVHQWVSEAGNPGNVKGVERVEITVASPLLKQGLVIVDTPGMGGLGAGHAAATLSFLPFADGLVFVSDASSELSAPEVDFLRRATELCPTVVFAQTKIDLYPGWQRIADLNRGHLERIGIQLPTVAVSSALRTEALARKDRALNERSRIPDVVKHLGDDIVTPAKASAAARSAGDGIAISAQVRAGLDAEKRVLADPALAQQALKDLEATKARLEFLRGPGAKWSILVGDRITDLSNSVSHRFRSSMRTISRAMDERIEVLSKGDEWDELTRYLQTVVADQVTDVFVALEEGRVAVRGEVVELLQDEQLPLAPRDWAIDGVDVNDLWQGKALDDGNAGKGKGKKGFQTGLTAVRGAQGGVIMFGMLGQFLPAAVGVLMASNPVLLGVGALFGSMGLADDRKRKVQMRRQSARSQVRQFIDDVQFEVTNQVGNVVRDMQRDMRDEFTERLTELQRTYTEAAQRAQQDAQKSQTERQQRIAEIDASMKSLAAIEATLAKAVA